jgi:hypothetical protein
MPSAGSVASEMGVSPTLAAKVLAQMGRGSDSQLAHVNPREIAMLLRAGGSGKRNPKTGLLEFDGGGGADSSAGNYGSALDPNGPRPGPTINIGGVAFDPTTATPSQTALVNSYTPAYNVGSGPDNTAVVNLQSGTLPIDPGLMQNTSDWIAQVSGGRGGGITDSFFDPVTNPGGVAYLGNPNYTTDAAGNAVFTPQGQQVYNQWQQQQFGELQKNAAGTERGLGGLWSTPLGGLTALGIPLAIGGAAEALGATGGLVAGSGATDLSGAAVGGVDATIPASMESAELASDPAAFSAATAAGGAAGTTAADTASTIGAGAGAVDSGSTAPFIGATWTQPATTAAGVPFDVSAAPATVAQAPVVPGGLSAASVSPGAAAGDVGAQGAAAAADVPFDVSAPAASQSIWQQIGSALGLGGGGTGATGAGGSSGGVLGGLSNVVNSPLVKLGGIAASGLGLVNDITKANAPNPIPGMANVNQIAQQSQTQGQILQSYLTTGTLPPAVQASVDQATQDGITAIKSRYAGMGVAPGSSQETQDIARLKQNAVVQGATLADQLTQQGISLTELSAQLYNNLVGYNSALNQQTGQAITSLATALAGGGNTLKLAA